MPPTAAQTPGRNHQPRKKPRRSDPTSSPPSLSDGRLPQKALQAQSLSRAKTPYPGYLAKVLGALALGGDRIDQIGHLLQPFLTGRGDGRLLEIGIEALEVI